MPSSIAQSLLQGTDAFKPVRGKWFGGRKFKTQGEEYSLHELIDIFKSEAKNQEMLSSQMKPGIETLLRLNATPPPKGAWITNILTARQRYHNDIAIRELLKDAHMIETEQTEINKQIKISMALRDLLPRLEGSNEDNMRRAQKIYDYMQGQPSASIDEARQAIIPDYTAENPSTAKALDQAANTLVKLATAAPESKKQLKELAKNIFKDKIPNTPLRGPNKPAEALHLLGCTADEICAVGVSLEVQTKSFEEITKNAIRSLRKLDLKNNTNASALCAQITTKAETKTPYTALKEIAATYKNPQDLAKALAALRFLSKENSSIACICDHITRSATSEQRDYITLRSLLRSDKNGNPEQQEAWNYLTDALQWAIARQPDKQAEPLQQIPNKHKNTLLDVFSNIPAHDLAPNTSLLFLSDYVFMREVNEAAIKEGWIKKNTE